MIHPSRSVTSTTAMNPPMSGQYMARNTTRPRAEPPARSPRGTPTPPGDAGPAGTRIAAGWAVANRPDDWGGRSHTDRIRTRRRVGADGRSSPRSSPSSTPCAVSSPPGPPHRSSTSCTSIKPDFSPLVQRRFPEIAGTSHPAKYLQTAGTLRAGQKRRAISARFAGRRRGRPPWAGDTGLHTVGRGAVSQSRPLCPSSPLVSGST